ncbi:UDP-N-acetylmuramoyl-tripeptide--D-alanyl-D-alanine ligase [Cohnella boryungensis]|uniref:UDP-N-acetylmuramoyl-tripeptide--D-alanyl-D-alanine ligase n=1 Tax=Cohnella boryungensis TaxID=768479 RepID=A0ABV8SI44_9BACL
MIRRTLQRISELAGSSFPTKDQSRLLVVGVSIDTRTLRKGNLYVPIVGERFNGHRFADAAIAAGAAAVLWNRNEPTPPPLGKVPVLMVEDTLVALQSLARGYREELRTKVIGITGSNGKTSTKDMLAGCLYLSCKTHKTQGNLNNHLGVPLTLLDMDEDTDIAVVEMGMSGLGEIERLSWIAQPDLAIITSIGEAHLGDLGSMRHIVQAKLEIVSGLRRGGKLIYHGDHLLLSSAVQAMSTKPQCLTFGIEGYNDYFPGMLELCAQGSKFTVSRFPGVEFELPLAGRHQILNALAVIAAVLEITAEGTEIARQGLAQAEITGMRNEIVVTEDAIILNDTYKSNPSSAKAALETLYLWQDASQRIAVLGDMHDLGEQSVSLHHEVGAQIDENRLDYLFAYGPLSVHMADGAARRMTVNRVYHYSDKQAMMEHVRSVLRPGAVVLVKSSRAMQLEEAVAVLRESGAREHAR